MRARDEVVTVVQRAESQSRRVARGRVSCGLLVVSWKHEASSTGSGWSVEERLGQLLGGGRLVVGGVCDGGRALAAAAKKKCCQQLPLSLSPAATLHHRGAAGEGRYPFARGAAHVYLPAQAPPLRVEVPLSFA